MKAKEVLQRLQITRPTLSKYVREGKISVVPIEKNHYIYNENDVLSLLGKSKNKNKINISYSRVSTSIQKNQLKDQSQRIYEYSITKGIELHKQIEDIKSGMSFDRKGFNELLDLIISDRVNVLIIENKDRLVRFSFELLEQICKYYNTQIIVINNEIQNKTYEQELTEDLISIIHYFSMKSYSNRRKLNKLKKELESENN